MAVAGRSPKHPRTDSDDKGLDVGALLEKAVEKATDRFSACMDAKIESIWERMNKRIDDKVDTQKLGPVMDNCRHWRRQVQAAQGVDPLHHLIDQLETLRDQ